MRGSGILRAVRLWWRAIACALLVSCSGMGASWADHHTPIRFDRLTLADGLSQSTVFSIFQDSTGFVWVGTEDGLNRYDGYKFTVYKHDPADPGSLPHDAVLALDEDASGDLWVGTDGGGLAKWNRETDRFVRYRHQAGDPDGLSSRFVRAVHVDPEGAIWIGTRDSGLDRLDPALSSFTHFGHRPNDPSSLSDDAVYTIFTDRSANLWVGTNGGLNRLDSTTGRFVRHVHDPRDPSSLSDDRVRSISEERDGALWVGTYRGGANRLDRRSGKFVRFRHDPEDPSSLGHDRVRSVLEDDAGRLWIGTSAGLDLWNRDGTGFTHYRHDPANQASLSDNHVMYLHQDRGGCLWVGTRNGGINKWNPLTWSFGHQTTQPSGTNGLSDSNVTAFSEDPTGNLWIGTFGGGLNMMDRVTGEFTHHRHDPQNPRSLSSDRVMALEHDHQGALWIATLDGGLNRLDPGTGTFESYRHDAKRPDSLGADGVMALFEDSRGILWVGTFGGGLERFHRHTETFAHFKNDPSDPRSLSGDRVTSIAEAPDGSLWVGTDGGGLNHFDPRTGTSQHFRHDPDDPSSLSVDTVFSLHVDPAGTLWVGTRGGGLDRMLEADGSGKAAFENYSARDGLPNEVIYSIRADHSGNLWLSTNNGLSKVDPRTGTFENFKDSHGLQANEFHFGSSFRSTSGKLFFGGLNGFNAFFPDRLPRNAHVPPVVLTAFLKFNKPVPTETPLPQIESIELGYRDDVVTFEFAALDFAAPEQNRYAYKLEGFDRDWIDLGNLHRVTYTNLDHGDYVFRVRAANNDGVWNEEGIAVALEVAAAPWRTPWAYGAYLLMVGGIGLGYVRVQQRKLEREEEYALRLEQDVETRTAELAEHASELEVLNDKLAKASLTDALTGLANRRFLFQYLDKEINLVQRRYARLEAGTLTPDALDLVFMMIDIDGFKAINDTCGHVAGDSVLTQVREILESACRSSDILIRWGGDEFLVVGRDSNASKLDSLAERIRSRIEDHAFVLGDGQVARVTCSIGFACYPFVPSDLTALPWERVVDVADRALYAAKRSGRNTWVGLSSTEKTSTKALLASIRERPGQLVERGELEVRTSIPEDRNLVWQEQ